MLPCAWTRIAYSEAQELLKTPVRAEPVEALGAKLWIQLISPNPSTGSGRTEMRFRAVTRGQTLALARISEHLCHESRASAGVWLPGAQPSLLPRGKGIEGDLANRFLRRPEIRPPRQKVGADAECGCPDVGGNALRGRWKREYPA